jgi:hypothetical protein
MDNEIWKPVNQIILKNGTLCNFIGYEVSNYGNVRTYKQRYGKGPKGLLSNHRPLTGRKDQKGYPQFWLIDINLKGRNFRAHTLVMQTFLGIPKEYEVVCHNDDVKSNNHISNLRYDTQLENVRDIKRNKNITF